MQREDSLITLWRPKSGITNYKDTEGVSNSAGRRAEVRQMAAG